MTDALIQLYRRLDLAQRRNGVRIAATILALVGCAAFFVPLLTKSYSLNQQRSSLYSALFQQSVAESGEHATSLKSTGEVHLNGRTYGGKELLEDQLPIFDEAGTIRTEIIPMLTERLLADQRPGWAPEWLLDQPRATWMIMFITIAWLLLIIWLNVMLPFLLTLIGTAVPVLIAAALESSQWMLAFAGIGVLTFTYLLLTRAVLAVFHPANQVLAVAHTVVKEASRRGLSLFFIIVLLIVLPLLPMMLDDDAPLRYRMQTFMSLSLGLTFVCTAVMTLFFSCASVAFEIRDRQIWHLVTKPLARINYLTGKWLGVAAVNLIILVVAGVSTFSFIQYLKTLPVAPGEVGDVDAVAVRDQVLAARVGLRPTYQTLDEERLRNFVDQRANADPEFAQAEKLPLALKREWEREAQQTYSMSQRTIPPGVENGRNYIFEGLKGARQLNSTMTLRYRFHILRDDEHKTFKAGFMFLNADNAPLASRTATYVPTMAHTFAIDPSLIQEDGTLRVRIVNLHDPGQRVHGMVSAINFEEKDFELLYKADTFEANFIRAVLTMWIKLCFLAALGISCATFLNFPVACLLSFTVFLSGMMGPFLAESLEYYGWAETEKMDWSNINLILLWIFEKSTSSIAHAIVFLLSSFGEYKPTENLVEGRLIPWSAVGTGFLKLGVLWSGLAMLLGYLVMRGRQLAIYSGHG